MAPSDESWKDETGAILTPTQRERLINGSEEVSSATLRMTRRRVRERIGFAMHDFSTILEYLPHDDLDQAFIEPIDRVGVLTKPRERIADALGVIYLGSLAKDETVGATGLGTVQTETGFIKSPLTKTGSFKRRAEKGIEKALKRRGISVNDVNISIELDVEGEIEEVPEDELEQRSLHELEELRMAGAITQEQYMEIMRERLELED